ncbi:EamA family transporter [Vibrio diazotrophicus]|uniref:DMT family transporter n=1 Tax=Vibrio diazotrophicus TaxID=685 RepID=UPI0022AF4BC5|nr:EamA family transporter [Vibrio diazotrophicus]MCZ4370205.1 EamA family transporter [Vibrio diazotrophicus]
MLKSNTNISGIFAVVLASVFWGTTGTAASFAPDISPLAIGASAMGGGGLLLLINARKKLTKDIATLVRNYKLLLCGGAAVAIYPLAFYSSMRFSGVAIGTLISIASAPFFTVLLERLISKKSISLYWVISFIVGAIGIVLLTLGKQDSSYSAEATLLHLIGIALGLIAALTYATYSWAARGMIERGVSSQSAMASMFGLAATLLLPSLWVTGDNLFADATHTAVVIYMATIPMFLGYLLFGHALKQLEASTATLITLLEPAVATLFAVSLVGERFTLIGWYGLAFIVVCLLLQVVPLPTSRLAKNPAADSY